MVDIPIAAEYLCQVLEVSDTPSTARLHLFLFTKHVRFGEQIPVVILTGRSAESANASYRCRSKRLYKVSTPFVQGREQLLKRRYPP